MRLPGIFLLAVVAILLAATPSLARSRDGMTPDDLVSLRHIVDPRISPSGDALVFVLRSTDREADSARTDLWYLDLTGKDRAARRLTAAPDGDISPRWSADGKSIYFISGRSGSAQIWILPAEGGQARLITSLPVPVVALGLSPAGNALAFSANVFPDCPTMACTAARLQKLEESPETGLAYDRLIMRFWDQWRDGRLHQLFVLPLAEDGTAAGAPVMVSAPLHGDIPEKPFGGSEAFAFSADGEKIFFSLKIQDEAESWSINSDIFVANTDGSGRPENLTASNMASDIWPIVAPDGRRLAWLATSGAQRWAAENKIKIIDLQTGETRVLAPHWDRSPQRIAFSPDGRSILATADHLGRRALWRIPVKGGKPAILAKGGWVTGFSTAGRRIIFSMNDLGNPTDLFEISTRNGPATTRRLTAVNGALLEKLDMAAYEQFRFAGAEGDEVRAFVVKPSGYKRGRKYPLVLVIHGGPHSSMGDRFNTRWSAQVLAGAGYGVMIIDFHGSTGYGQKFVESIMEDRGGRTLTDQKLGLAAALEKYDWIDGQRVCAVGSSFGGYMVNWIAGAWPDRFRCLITHEGMFDNRMKYYTSDYIGYLEEGFGGTYFDNPAGYERFNPAALVQNWQTPTLVIHGRRDYRVPLTQGIGTFTALQRKGIPSRFLYFPDENHWIQGPANSLQWFEEVIGWLDRWLKEPDPQPRQAN